MFCAGFYTVPLTGFCTEFNSFCKYFSTCFCTYFCIVFGTHLSIGFCKDFYIFLSKFLHSFLYDFYFYLYKFPYSLCTDHHVLKKLCILLCTNFYIVYVQSSTLFYVPTSTFLCRDFRILFRSALYSVFCVVLLTETFKKKIQICFGRHLVSLS